jgi:hypothetical protein
MKHEHTLLSFGGGGTGVRNVEMDFFVVGVWVGVGVEFGVVALVGGSGSRGWRMGGGVGGEGRECECVSVIVSSPALFTPHLLSFPIHRSYKFLFQVERSRGESTHIYAFSITVTIGCIATSTNVSVTVFVEIRGIVKVCAGI